ncbi:MAG TPA: septum site-determining protein MinC [Rudaea sp.]|nr:septum site-determining protein MinC [Rudaea sp.]
MRSEPAAAAVPAFELKFGQVGIANLRLFAADPEALREELARKVEAAPQLFGRAPLVLDLGHLPALPDADAARALLAAVRAAGLLPVGLAYGTSENAVLAEALDLPLFAKFRAAYDPAPKAAEAAAEKAPPAPAPAAEGARALRHDKPVRSGQQVYARGRDLVLAATIGNGAEVIADGSIHVYGRLSGRALAGAQGDETARIYCLDFRAELVSIAGRYRVFEDIPADLRGKPVQAWLDGEKLLLQRM